MKVILIIIDGLRYDTGIESLGYLNHLLEMGRASRYKIRTEIPTFSRPMYETILTGVEPANHLVTCNQIAKLSNQKSIFHIAKENGLITSAAAYYWISELYNRSPFNYIEDIIQNDVNKTIQHGIFYFEDTYPDSHLILQGNYLKKTYDPDFLLIHTMGVDYSGHKYGGRTPEYRGKVLEIDSILSSLIEEWTSNNDTTVIVTADHGMTEQGHHGGDTNEEREVPCYLISPSIEHIKSETLTSQLIIAPTICEILGIEKSKHMVPKTLFDIKA